MDPQNIRIGIGIVVGFIIGVAASVILSGEYNILGTAGLSCILAPVCTFVGGLIGAFWKSPPANPPGV